MCVPQRSAEYMHSRIHVFLTLVGEDPAAHGHWCAFTDLYHTIPYHTMRMSA